MLEGKNNAFIELPQTNSRIGEMSSYNGVLRFKTSMSILGKMEGRVQGGELLVIFPKAEVKGEIHAEFVLVLGNVTGNIHAKKGVYLYSTAYMRGEIHATTIRMQPGVNFEGLCNLINQSNIDIHTFTRSDLRAYLIDTLENTEKQASK